MSELGLHQGGDGVEDLQSLPSSHEGEIDSDEEELLSVEPQAEEDSGGLRNRKMKTSCPATMQAEEGVRCASEEGSGKEKSSHSGRKRYGRVKRVRLGISGVQALKVSIHLLLALWVSVFVHQMIRLVFFLLLALGSRSFPGDLYQRVDSKDLHQKISEMRIGETPLQSVQSVAQDGTRVFKWARHDFLLLRTANDTWYKAEKHGPSSRQAGVYIYPVPGPGAGTIRFRSSISVDFSLAQGLAILTDHKLAYSLWGENCWKYAHSRAEAILKSCVEIASDDNVRNELKRELENLMVARRRMPSEIVDIVEL